MLLKNKSYLTMTHSNKFSKRILAVALLLASWLSVDAFNVNGIYYDFVDKANRTVKVSYRGSDYDSFDGEYVGAVKIPATVTYKGVKYSVEEIDMGAFYECTSLTSITIPNSVVIIGSNAFFGCDGLISIKIPNSVKKIGVYAFSGCSRLTSITIPNSVVAIEDYAFSGCRDLSSIVVENGNRKYDSRDSCNAIIETSTNTLIAGCKNTIIPNSIKEIGKYAFCGSLDLNSIIIPNSVTAIREYAFAGCWNVTTIDIPNTITTIELSAFRKTGLISIYIHNPEIKLHRDVFLDCDDLEKIVIPRGTRQKFKRIFPEEYHSKLVEQ